MIGANLGALASGVCIGLIYGSSNVDGLKSRLYEGISVDTDPANQSYFQPHFGNWRVFCKPYELLSLSQRILYGAALISINAFATAIINAAIGVIGCKVFSQAIHPAIVARFAVIGFIAGGLIGLQREPKVFDMICSLI